MAERPIHLDLRDLAARTGTSPDTPHQQRREPSAQERERFAQAMNAGGAGHPESTTGAGTTPAAATPAVAPSPLLGLLPAPLAPSAPRGTGLSPEAAARLTQDLGAMVQQLAVGSDGKGGQALRVELDADQMPGVSVSVFEDAGAWVAAFHCREEASYIRLAEPAQQMAWRLAESLRRDAVWRVVAEGLPPDGAWRRLVNNESEGLPSTESFAACAQARR